MRYLVAGGLALSVRERLLAMQELGELSAKLATMPRMAAPPNDNG